MAKFLVSNYYELNVPQPTNFNIKVGDAEYVSVDPDVGPEGKVRLKFNVDSLTTPLNIGVFSTNASGTSEPVSYVFIPGAPTAPTGLVVVQE